MLSSATVRRHEQSVLKRNDTQYGSRTVEAYIHRPREELYDLSSDPNELKNLAADPAHGKALTDLRQRLRTWQQETADPWTILYREEKTAGKK